jgi:hypothetical protein
MVTSSINRKERGQERQLTLHSKKILEDLINERIEVLNAMDTEILSEYNSNVKKLHKLNDLIRETKQAMSMSLRQNR